jgi:hypothetical protein
MYFLVTNYCLRFICMMFVFKHHTEHPNYVVFFKTAKILRYFNNLFPTYHNAASDAFMASKLGKSPALSNTSA